MACARLVPPLLFGVATGVSACLAHAQPEETVGGDAEIVVEAGPSEDEGSAEIELDANDGDAEVIVEQSPPPEPEVKEVVVFATDPRRVAGSTQVIGEKQLERNEYDDPHKVLLQAPGVYVRGEDGFGLRPNIGLRGANSDRSKKVTLMEDGILFGPAPYSAPAAYYFPIITRMRSVRVVKGPAGIVYGPQTIGGAIDLRTRSIPGMTSGAVDVAVGQDRYGKGHVYVGSSTEKAGFLIEGVHLRNDGFKNLDGGGNTGFYRNEWMFKGSYTLDPYADVQNTFGLKLGYSDETSNETYLGLTDDDFRDSPFRRYRASANDRMRWHRTQIALTHTAELSTSLSLETTLYRNDFTRSWNRLKRFRNGPSITEVLRNPEGGTREIFYDVLTGAEDSGSPGEALMIGPNFRDFVSQGVQIQARWEPKTGPITHEIEYGVRVHNDRIRRLHSEDGFLMIDGELVFDGQPTTTTDDNSAETHAVALHALDALTWGPLTLTPGVRMELIRWTFQDRLTDLRTGDSYAVVIPGGGAFLALPWNLGLLAGVYRGFSPEAPGRTPGLSAPEKSINYEAGVRWASGNSSAEAIGFFNDYRNLTDICTQSNGCLGQDLDRQFDAGKARVFGLETHAAHEIETSIGLTFPLMATYTLTMSEFLENFQSADPQFGTVSAGDELPYIPEHQFSFTVGGETKHVGVSVTGTYVDAMREQAGSGPLDPALSTDSHFLLDVGARGNVTPRFQVYTNVRNVLNDQYVAARRPLGARPGIKRWAQVGARYKF